MAKKWEKSFFVLLDPSAIFKGIDKDARRS
jgi:hypothetical protein